MCETIAFVLLGVTAIFPIAFAAAFYIKYADERDLRRSEEKLRKGVDGV